MSSGARTPPDVPLPRDTAQMIDLMSRIPKITWRGTLP